MRRFLRSTVYLAPLINKNDIWLLTRLPGSKARAELMRRCRRPPHVLQFTFPNAAELPLSAGLCARDIVQAGGSMERRRGDSGLEAT